MFDQSNENLMKLIQKWEREREKKKTKRENYEKNIGKI